MARLIIFKEYKSAKRNTQRESRLIVGCVTSRGKYFMHVKNENKLIIKIGIKIGLFIIQAILNDGRKNLVCHWETKNYWILTEIKPCNRTPQRVVSRKVQPLDYSQNSIKHYDLKRKWRVTRFWIFVV